MLRKAIGLAVASVVPFMLASALLTSPSTGTAEPQPAAIDDRLPDTPPEAAVNGDVPEPKDEGDEGVVDMQGNQVTDAVAKYKFDATGSLYELHSPQTEIPRLKPPKS